MSNKDRILAIGIAYIGVGDYGFDGAMASALKRQNRVANDTVQFEFKEKTATQFFEEYSDDPYHTMFLKKDADGIQFAIPSPTVEERVMYMGGVITGDGKWAEPTAVPTINKSFVIRSKPFNGIQRQYEFVNCSVSAYTSQAPGKEKEEWLLVKATKQAVKDGEGKKKSGYFVSDIPQVDDLDEVKEVSAIDITGIPKVGEVLRTTIAPVDATGAYQWMKKTGSGAASNITGATSTTYIPVAGDVGAKILVKFTASGEYSGEVVSAETIAVAAAS